MGKAIIGIGIAIALVLGIIAVSTMEFDETETSETSTISEQIDDSERKVFVVTLEENMGVKDTKP